MKKYILSALTAIAAILFSACSNDDITIERHITISVDASGVTAPFKNIEPAKNTNYLSSLSDGYRLRVRVLVYDSERKAIVNLQQYRDSYLDVGKPFSIGLENGTYTFVAITDVVPPSSNKIEYWSLKNESELDMAELICEYDMNINPYKYGILGVLKRQITITKETQNVILQPTPVGALLRVLFYGLKTAATNGYSRFYLCTNTLPNNVVLMDKEDDKSAISPHSISTKNEKGESLLNGLRYFLDARNETDDNPDGDYMFFLPCKLRMCFAYPQEGKLVRCGALLEETFEAGVGYEVSLNLVESNHVVDVNSVVTFSQPSAGGKSQSAPIRSLRLADVQ